MTTTEIKAMWNQMTPAERISKLGASKTSSKKSWDAMGVMAQMLICLPLDNPTEGG